MDDLKGFDGVLFDNLVRLKSMSVEEIMELDLTFEIASSVNGVGNWLGGGEC